MKSEENKESKNITYYIAMPVILGVISITEIIVIKDFQASIVLWFIYGLYKVGFFTD